MTRIREANKQYNIHIVHITYLSPLLKFGKWKVFTVRKLVSCDVDKVRGITIFVRKKVGGIDPTHPPRVRRLWAACTVSHTNSHTVCIKNMPQGLHLRPCLEKESSGYNDFNNFCTLTTHTTCHQQVVSLSHVTCLKKMRHVNTWKWPWQGIYVTESAKFSRGGRVWCQQVMWQKLQISINQNGCHFENRYIAISLASTFKNSAYTKL